MQHKGIFIIEIIILNILTVFLLAGCGENEVTAPPVSDQREVSAAQDISDRQRADDTAVFVSCDADEKTVRLVNKENGRIYEVSYNELTEFYDKYGKVSVPELFNAGDVVDVEISVNSRMMTKLQVSPSSFIRRNIDKYSINVNRGIFSSGEVNYRINENTAVFKGGKKIKATDIVEGDTLTVSGIDTSLYSIVITSGDGHVNISGTEYFIGGWVQIGKDIIKPVTEEMIIDVPEGEYDMVVTYNGRGGTKHISVERGRELKVDISDLKGELIKYGILVFTIKPADAEPSLRINGEEYDYLEPVELEYGIYKLEVEAEGYIPIKERLSVGQEMSNVQIELMKAEDDEEEEKEEASEKKTAPSSNLPTVMKPDTKTPQVSAGQAASSSSSYADEEEGNEDTISTTVKGKLFIDAPDAAEVYYDGSYKGVVPCSFAKTSGTHVITLRRDGYKTKTYTITLDDSLENETYSFSALVSE